MRAGTNDKYKGKAERTDGNVHTSTHDMRYNSGMRLTARLISVDVGRMKEKFS